MNQEPAVPSADAAERSTPGPVLLHVWMVDPQAADRHVQLLKELFEKVSDQPGFVSAKILETPGRSWIAAVVEMRTVEDRERLEALPQVHDALYQLRPAANFVFQVYQQIGEFTRAGR
jgi:hypothetical protein